MKKRNRLLIALAVLFATFFIIDWAQEQDPPVILQPYAEGEVLLKFKPGVSEQERMIIREGVGGITQHKFLSGAEHWKLGAGISVEQALERLQGDSRIQYAEPNYELSLNAIPNDPRFNELWGMHNTGQTGGTYDADIDAPEAWETSTGSSDVIVGLIDTGTDYNHPDLAANIWTNPGEIPGNGIDDDGNGYVDDIHGIDACTYGGHIPDSDPMDDEGHGTHTAGTIGAIGNNGIGVAGVNWHVKIMPLKFIASSGYGYTADAVTCMDYSVMMGVDLTSNSWGGGAFAQTLYDAIANANANNMAFVAAAGNSGVDTDSSPHYPSSMDLPNIIAVAATDHNDAKASWSNYGATSVDLAAPGVDVLSTLPGSNYGLGSGTSMATPHVAGVCALIRAVSPGIPVAQMKNVLLNSVDVIPAMTGRCVSNGRLNAHRSIAEPDNTPPGMIDDLAAVVPGSNTMGLSWTATGDDGDVGTAMYYEVRYSTSTIDDTNWDSATRAGNEPIPLVVGSPQTMEVRNLEASTLYYFAMKAFDDWGNGGPISNVASASTLPPPTGYVDPTSIFDELYTGEESDHDATLSNIGVGTLDFTIPMPLVGEPMSAPPEPLELGKDEEDPRSGDPVTENTGGPDAFGYRWIDSDEPGGPVFNWMDISATGMPVTLTNDDQTSTPVALGFEFPFYGGYFDSIRVCTNGWLSFTSSLTSYSNQPLPTSSGPENMVAPFWDDLHPHSVNRTFFQSFGTYAIVQWQAMERYSGSGAYTFQVILEASGAITFQYLDVESGDLSSATVGIQDATKTIGLQVAFNQAYLHNNLAVRISAIPQWLTVSPTSGRLYAGESIPINMHMDASGLEGGTYPATVNIHTNDPENEILTIDVSLHVIGAPDAEVMPSSLDFGDVFLGVPTDLTLTVINSGTDTLHVTDIVPSHPELSPNPTTFDIAPHGSQDVTVTWTSTVLGAFSGSVTVQSDDAAEPNIVVPCTGNAFPAPIMVYNPTSFHETLYSGNQITKSLTVRNTGGYDLIVNASANMMTDAGDLVWGPEGFGGPDAFGYRWKDSDEPGGPIYDWEDISTTGTPITFYTSYGSVTLDDGLSNPIDMGMTFPFYGNNFGMIKVSTNGWLTFNLAETSSRLSNRELPSTYGAANMLALLWDDLHLRTGDVRYLYDGTRFIVQYTNVEKYSPSGYDLTFQVQLYPSGKIIYQYQMITPGGTESSWTVGIQDETKTIGLTACHNTAGYVHDNLAIQFSAKPDWLGVTPPSATIPPGGSFVFDVKFDSTERIGGLYEGEIVLTNNIPEEQRIPALLTVIGAPDVDIVPASYDYGTQFSGYPYLTTFQIVNNGTDVLNVSNVYSTDPTLTVSEYGVDDDGEQTLGGFSLPPGLAKLMQMSWYPTVPMLLNAQVHVLSDDPDTPDKVMPVHGLAIPPPVAVWSPSSFTEDLMVGDIVHRTLHLENQGGSDLDYTVSLRDTTTSQVTVYDELKLGDDEEDPRPGILGSGGPDMFGYKWQDSDEPGGPIYNWVDITSVGTHIPFSSYTSGQNLGPYPIGFDFPFYENTFNEFRVCSNGWVSFTSTSTDSSNDPLPTSGAPENLLAAFWDSMIHDTSDGSEVYYYYDGSRLIIQYNDLRKSGYMTPPFFTFQIILYPSGNIMFQYHTLDPDAPLNSHTIGIQNATKDDGLTVVYNDASYIHEGLAIRFRALDWLAVSPTSGTIPAGEAVDMDVMIDTTNLIGGDYAASIDFSTNDPAHTLFGVPVSMHVTGIPDIDSTPASLSFPMTYVGFFREDAVTIKNVGTDVLHITDVAVTGDFSQSGLTPPVDLPVGGTVPVTVTFTPTWDGMRYGEISVTSDDPDEMPFVIPLEGYALFPPEINVAPPEINTALPPGGTRTKTLTVCNTGGSDLTWDVSPNIISNDPTVMQYDYLDLGKDDIDPRSGILGSGGPDLYGYTWIDSDEPGGPVFDWVDISDVGTQIPFPSYSDDNNQGPFPIGFPFNFYGNTFNEFYACTNGWVSFTSTRTTYSNQPLPNSGYSVPENLLAWLWDDLVHRSGTGSEPVPSAAYYYNDGTRLIIQYNHMYRIANYTDDINAQIILYPSGKIVYQYGTFVMSTANSHTIGIQNATKDDGLTVVFNDSSYTHENMAIEFKRFPEWVKLYPMSGTILAGECQDVTVTLDAAGLEDGIHEAMINFTSNDPYTPLVSVPVSLNVSLVATTWTDFDPDVLNLSSNGNLVRMTVELPTDLDPYGIRLSSVMLNDIVPALPHPAPEYGDLNENSIVDVRFSFDRLAVEAILPEGQEVNVYIQGEVEDIQWWRGMDTIRTMHPRILTPEIGAYFLSGQVVPITWDPPIGGTPNYYKVHLSRNSGVTWEELASNVNGTSFDWTASGDLTTDAYIRVVAMDNQGVMGYDISDGPFTIAGSELYPPYPIGSTLELVISGTDLNLAWKAPVSDLTHGPADRYRILRAENPVGPFNEVDVVTETYYVEPISDTEGISLVYYRIIAANAAGDEQ